ncbi:hypothetical protein Tco_0092262 [Tanacetum coccineum]
MSSPNRSTSDIEDAFSSMNILNYTSVSPDYFPASSRSSSFNSLENSTDNMIPPVFLSFYNNPCFKDVQAFYAKESPILSPDPIASPAILTPSPILPPSLLFDLDISLFLKNYYHQRSKSILHLLPQLRKCSIKMYLKHHEEQIKDILNYLEELSFHHIEKMEEGQFLILNKSLRKSKLDTKRIGKIFRMSSTGSESTNSLNSYSFILAMGCVHRLLASASNLTGTPAVKTGNYKEFISCQPFCFNGTEGAVALDAGLNTRISILSKQMC